MTLKEGLETCQHCSNISYLKTKFKLKRGLARFEDLKLTHFVSTAVVCLVETPAQEMTTYL